jgi:hypothetical protein
MKRLILAAVFVLMALNASAQGVTVRFYIVPREGAGTAKDDYRPKYVRDMGVEFDSWDYGLEPTFLVAAEVTTPQHTSLASNIDVVAIPQNLDATISATALPIVQSNLEALHIPAGWVTTSHTYRDVLRIVGKLFQFMQRFDGIHARIFFESGITLDTRINQLTQAQRDALNAAAASMGLNTSSITGPMLIRQALKILGDQMPAFVLKGETF